MRVCMRCGERFVEFVLSNEIKALGLDIYCPDCVIWLLEGLSAESSTTVTEHLL